MFDLNVTKKKLFKEDLLLGLGDFLLSQISGNGFDCLCKPITSGGSMGFFKYISSM